VNLSARDRTALLRNLAAPVLDAVEVALPPSTNNLFATAGRRRVKSGEYRKWLSATQADVCRLRAPVRYPVAVVLTVKGRVHGARDLDNTIKPTLDQLVACGVLTGDSLMYLHSVTVRRGDDEGEPRVRIEIHDVGGG
jgi:Holliday junction resolvase RusA-like endonuclease